ncbi:MAG: hypothetical protein ACR2PT_10685 [Endozoicomonas sp.]
MRVTKTFTLASMAITGFLSISNLLAAEDGTLGLTSTGNFRITLTINMKYRVSKLKDINVTKDLPTTPTDNLQIGNSPFCIYTNDPSKKFALTLSGLNNEGQDAKGFFLFKSGGGVEDKIAYSVKVTLAEQTLSPGLNTLTPMSGANNETEDCVSGTGGNGSVELSMSPGEYRKASPNTPYYGGLQLVVSAQ